MDEANRVDWARPGVAAVFEDMVSVLISRLNPAAQRIDGSGGDGGRDVQVPVGSRLEIYQLKSFTGRLSSQQGRRVQVARSLKKAAAHNPVAWYLVAPIEPTAGERAWFTQLTSSYSFPCIWHDKTWLDNHMTLFPDIPRYFLDGAAQEVVQRLLELREEQAAFNAGVFDAIDRLRALTARFNADNPYYAFGFTCQPDGSVTARLQPRYLGAERDCPVTIQPTFSFPDTDGGRAAAAALEATFAYGSASSTPGEFVHSVTVDGLASLSGTLPGGDFSVGPALIEHVDRLRTVVRVTRSDGVVLAQLPLKAREGTRGARGVVILLDDASGALTLTLTVDLAQSAMQLTYAYSHTGGMLPAILLPTLEFLRHLCAPNQLEIFDGSIPLGPPIVIPHEPHPGVDSAVGLIRLLEEMQRRAGVYFAVPESFTPDELDDIELAHALLSGQKATGTWRRFTLAVPAGYLRSEDAAAYREQRIPELFVQSPFILELAGERYPIGIAKKTFASARVLDWPALREDEAADTSITLSFEPVDDETVTLEFVDVGSLGTRSVA